MLRKLCFFNFLHNGDIFTGKGYAQAIMRAYPGIDYAYALGAGPGTAGIARYEHALRTNHYAIKDLRCQLTTTDDLPPELDWYERFLVYDGWLLVNTWIGAYADEVLKAGEVHANYPNLQRMWSLIFDEVNSTMGMNLRMPEDVWAAVPTTDWSVYNCALADAHVDTHPATRRLLFCNGPVRSAQSAWGGNDMHEVIETLAGQHPDWDMLCTRPFPTSLPNVHFTDDIFLEQPCDINEIGYLSTRCDLIWGKVSGPYIYCHVPENIFDPRTVFFSSSDRPSDSLPYGCEGVRCHYYHSPTADPDTLVTQLTEAVLGAADREPAGSMIVLP